jgi:hypothetical protein
MRCRILRSLVVGHCKAASEWVTSLVVSLTTKARTAGAVGTMSMQIVSACARNGRRQTREGSGRWPGARRPFHRAHRHEAHRFSPSKKLPPYRRAPTRPRRRALAGSLPSLPPCARGRAWSTRQPPTPASSIFSSGGGNLQVGRIVDVGGGTPKRGAPCRSWIELTQLTQSINLPNLLVHHSELTQGSRPSPRAPLA